MNSISEIIMLQNINSVPLNYRSWHFVGFEELARAMSLKF